MTTTPQMVPIVAQTHTAALTTPVTVRGDGLTIDDVVRVARRGAAVQLTDEADILRRVHASCDY
ncbi:MAG TPA: hypothetical protein VFU22_05340, partial [Roseiflexaceae bacterium]|nr:hypothetical protein [Roseiflexaceae bacterium]